MCHLGSASDSLIDWGEDSCVLLTCIIATTNSK